MDTMYHSMCILGCGQALIISVLNFLDGHIGQIPKGHLFHHFLSKDPYRQVGVLHKEVEGNGDEAEKRTNKIKILAKSLTVLPPDEGKNGDPDSLLVVRRVQFVLSHVPATIKNKPAFDFLFIVFTISVQRVPEPDPIPGISFATRPDPIQF